MARPKAQTMRRNIRVLGWLFLGVCAGVTLRAVATALEIPVRGGEVTAEGDLDFRGTLGVDRDAAVGLHAIRMTFQLDTDADDEQLATLVKLTERYCVVLQTLTGSPEVTVECCLLYTSPSPRDGLLSRMASSA